MSSRAERPCGVVEIEGRDGDLDDGRIDEEELLLSEAAETISALLAASGLRQKELAARMRLSEPRVSRLLKGDANTTLRAIADVGWALGYRFELVPVPLEDRGNTPAGDDPAPPAWINNLRRLIGRQSSAPSRRTRRPASSRRARPD